jgi:ketosteroid isomerase-like protein
VNEVEARIQRLEGIEAIRDLAVRYGLALDDRDFDALSAMFTDDACLRTLTGVKGRGRDGVSAYLRASNSGVGPSNHIMHGHQITLDLANLEQASGIVTAHAESMRSDGQMLIALRYNDTYRRVDGSWKFQERVQTFLYRVEAKDYAGVLSSEFPVMMSKDNRQRSDWPAASKPS